MSGWDAVRRVTLAEPWSEFWVDVYLDPPMGAYLDMKDAASAATAGSADAVDALIKTMEPLIAAHNMTNRDGSPITWGVRTMGSRLVLSLKDALIDVMKDGEPADPLPTTEPSSPGSVSQPSRSRRSTRSGVSPA